MTLYRLTVHGTFHGRRVYLVEARCAGDAIRYVMRRDRSANWLTTDCRRA